MMKKTIVRQHSEAERRWFAGGGLHLWKLTAEETGGEFFLLEDHLVEGKTTPLHTHPDAAETVYILEGTICCHLAGVEREVGPGGVVMVPPGVPHAFRVTSPTARMLAIQTPGGGEAFFRDASDPSSDDSGPVDFARLREAAGRHDGIEILGPPPFKLR